MPTKPKDSKPKDSKPKDSKPKDSNPKDSKDAKPKDAKPKDPKPKDSKPKDSESEEEQEAKPKEPKSQPKPEVEVKGYQGKNDKTKLFTPEIIQAFWLNTKTVLTLINNGKPSDVYDGGVVASVGPITHFYAVTISGFSLKNDNTGTAWSLVKVGKTDVEGTKRADDVRATIRRFVEAEFKFADDVDVRAEVVFQTPKGFADVSSSRKVEERVRSYVGLAVSPKKAKSMNLPIHTEWAIAPTARLARIQQFLGNNTSESDTSGLKNEIGRFDGDAPKKLEALIGGRNYIIEDTDVFKIETQ